MKRSLLLLIIWISSVGALQCYGQHVTDTLRFAERLWYLKKKALVLEYMDLTEAEKASFWPVFESYNLATQYLEMECVYLITTYAREYSTLGGKKLENISKRILKNEMLLAKIRKQYFKKFRKALTPEDASTFVQLDKAFSTIIRAELQQELSPREMFQALYSDASLLKL